MNLNKAQVTKMPFSFLIVTATEIEKEAFFAEFHPYKAGETTKYISQNQSYTIGYFGRHLVAHVQSNMGAMRSNGSAFTVYDGLSDIAPAAVLMLGIAFGVNKESQEIGDVLISKRVKPYELTRIGTDAAGKIEILDRNAPMEPAPTIVNVFANCNDDPSFRAVSGTILSGEKLVDNVNYRDQLVLMSRDIIGGEMEACGVAAAAQRLGNANWIIVKAICDWGDGNKGQDKESNQKIAAEKAVSHCLRIFESPELLRIQGVTLAKKSAYAGKKRPINGYKMYFFRNKYRKSFNRLARETQISEKMLRSFEVFAHEGDIPTFSQAYSCDITALERALHCAGELSNIATDQNVIRFFRNKGARHFFPVQEYKAIFFDFDGTLTVKQNKMSTWQLLWKLLGYSDDDCIALHRKFTSKDINHKEWCSITEERFKDKGLTRQQVEGLSSSIKLVPNVIDVLSMLAKEGIKLFIVSGSINTIIESVLGDNKQLFSEISCNKFFYDTSGKLEAIRGTEFDFEGKAKYIKKTAESMGISVENMLFVGNSNNDEAAYKSGANTLLINPAQAAMFDRKRWQYLKHEVNSFYELLPYFMPQTYSKDDVANFINGTK